MRNATAPDLMKTAEVADLLRVTRSTVLRWSKETPPRLRAVRIGDRAVRFHRGDVLALLEQEGAA